MRESYNGIDRINFGANVKQFARKTKKKNNIVSIVRPCKTKNNMLFFLV